MGTNQRTGPLPELFGCVDVLKFNNGSEFVVVDFQEICNVRRIEICDPDFKYKVEYYQSSSSFPEESEDGVWVRVPYTLDLAHQYTDTLRCSVRTFTIRILAEADNVNIDFSRLR